MNKRTRALFAVLSVVLIGLTACGKSSGGGQGSQGAPGGRGGPGGPGGNEKTVTVIVETATNGRLEKFLNISGNLSARDEVKIYPDVSGKISSFAKLEGQYVYRGEAVAYIDRFQVGAEYALSPIVAPVSGTITTYYVTKGQNVTTATPIASVGNINIIDAFIYVPETSVGDIRVGQKVYVSVPAVTNKVFEGKIYRRDFAVDTSTHTMLVRAELDNSSRQLLPGMYADIQVFLAAADDSIILPIDSVFKQDDGTWAVYLNVSNKAILQPVKIGLETSEYVALSSGVREGDEVIIFGKEYLTDGASIRPIRENASTSDSPTNSVTTTTVSGRGGDRSGSRTH